MQSAELVSSRAAAASLDDELAKAAGEHGETAEKLRVCRGPIFSPSENCSKVDIDLLELFDVGIGRR